MSYFNVLSQNLFRETEENHKNPSVETAGLGTEI
jgi:hypothetical protein